MILHTFGVQVPLMDFGSRVHITPIYHALRVQCTHLEQGAARPSNSCRAHSGPRGAWWTLFKPCLHCHVLNDYIVLYHMLLYYTILYYTILYYTILYYTILYYTILYYTILYYTILYYTILYYTILYYTILYYTRLD